MNWREHKADVLNAHGLTFGDWAILITAGYYIPVAGERFIDQATWESQGNANPKEVRNGFERSLAQGWVQLVPEGHVEYNLNVFGERTGDVTQYPENGVILTQSGHALLSKVAIAEYGADRFRRPGPSQQFYEV